MSDYTPTMERLRADYLRMRAERFGFTDLYAAEWDRALAAHDAEVRAGVVTEEPEWEYRVRLHPDIEYKPNENRATYTPPTTPHTSLERAQEMAGLNPRYRATYHRRRKAGPWVPVKQEGAEK